jgi:hypothetical protein
MSNVLEVLNLLAMTCGQLGIFIEKFYSIKLG